MKSNLHQAADNAAGFKEKTPEEREKLRREAHEQKHRGRTQKRCENA